MRTKLRSKISLLFMTCAVLLAIPAIALADIVVADGDLITLGNQAGSSTNPIDIGTVKAGGSVERQVSFQLQCAGNRHVDQNQSVTLDATPGTSGVPTGASLVATAATIGPIPASWTDDGTTCPSPAPTPIEDNGNTTVKFTAPSNAANGAVYNFSVAWSGTDVTLSPGGNNDSSAITGSTQVFFRVTVDAQAPDTTIASGPSGTVNSSSATFTFSSNEANSTFETRLDNGAWVANGTATSKTYNSLGDGSHTFDVRATDAAGNVDQSPASRSWTVQTDSTAPVITPDVQGTLGNNGWYTSNVSVSWTVTDNESAVTSKSASCDTTTTINTDTTGQTVSCTATSAGGTDTKSVTIKRDATPPVVTFGAVSGTQGTNSWYTSPVTQAFNASDATSDLAGPAIFTKESGANEEGSNVLLASGPVSDNAGNTNSGLSAGPFKVDLSDPVANCASAPSGWSQNDVNIRCQPTDAVSGLADNADADFNLSTSVPNGTETANASTGDRVVADAAGRTVTAGPISGIKVDKKAPVLTDEGPTTQPDGDGGWYKSAVTNGFKATDGGSGFAPNGNLTDSFTKSSGTDEGEAVKIASGTVSDAVGNSTASIDSAAFKIDLSDPTNVTFEGGPAAGGSYFFGETPDKPSCTADDNVSGFASCEVTGYSTAVGSHTMTATAKDNAGRTATATRSYTVKAWITKGFYQPVDMTPANSPTVYNTVKGGSTVPLKFELFAGSELTDTSAIKSLQATKVTCVSGATIDDIETVATGGTSLRYDSTGGQFIYNWKTPTGAGSCYKVTVTAQDLSTITAYFKMK